MSAPPLHIVLHQPEIPHNTGSVGRTCVALGAKLWLVRPLGFQIDDRQLRRAGLDYWQHLDWEIVDDWHDLKSRMPTNRIWCFTKYGNRSYSEPNYAHGDALLFGSESSGLPESIREENAERLMRIPTTDNVRSLNLSVAAAVAGYEVCRQIGAHPG